MSLEDLTATDRRTYLAAIAGAGTGGVAGCSFLTPGDDAPTRPLDAAAARTLAERFAPTVYFDEHERWFPTDPRPYETDVDGTPVVGGFDAVDGYHERFDGAGSPPDPTVFYHAIEYRESPLAVVQFWFYSVFDQFSTNFHWHDWELLQVFVDADTGEPRLYVASSHSGAVPNNEFQDPERTRPRILSELGSHSSGLSLNDDAEHFQRLSLGGTVADITNSVIEGIDAIADVPLAYGLPRDEGLAIPYAVPELDGEPVHEHDRLPSVDASDLLPEALTVHSFDELQSPPDLPTRETGYRFDHRGSSAPGTDVTYDLRPTADLEHIEEFTGPQLSFEFTVPGFVEDAVASHVTTAGVPWTDTRYVDPASDISEPDHRRALADRYDAIGEPPSVDGVIAAVTNAVSEATAPEDEGLTTVPASLELFALLRSDPEPVPTFDGIAVVQDVPAGTHELTVNGAGVTPHSETVTVTGDDGLAAAGVEGEVPVVERRNAVKLAVDPGEADSDLSDLAVEDDFAGRLYDAPLAGPDAVYVHTGGAYTVEVGDSDGELGAHRVNPGDVERVRVADPHTGKAPLSAYIADVAVETRNEVTAGEDDDDQQSAVTSLANALDELADAARLAAAAAAAGDREQADRRLDTATERLDRVATRLQAARDPLPADIARAAANRLDQARRRTAQAKDAEKL